MTQIRSLRKFQTFKIACPIIAVIYINNSFNVIPGGFTMDNSKPSRRRKSYHRCREILKIFSLTPSIYFPTKTPSRNNRRYSPPERRSNTTAADAYRRFYDGMRKGMSIYPYTLTGIFIIQYNRNFTCRLFLKVPSVLDYNLIR